MNPAKIGVALAFFAVLAAPFIVRALAPVRDTAGDTVDDDARTLVIVTPHIEQIRVEFAREFARWHEAQYGEPARIDYRTPGGTSEIIRQLEAQFSAAIKSGRYTTADDGSIVLEPGSIGYDLMFGGGTYEHGRLKRGVRVALDSGDELSVPMSTSARFEEQQLLQWYGPDNWVGSQEHHLYDPEQYWLGVAMSSFGIVYNRLVLNEIGVAPPDSFQDLADERYFHRIALVDPRMSGSVTTTYESIMNKEGWKNGWRLLREMSANARYFATSSTRPPMDVSQGDAAAGLAIDFYGRGQAESALPPGVPVAEGRVGYADPTGAVYIDPDPVSILRGGPDFELAQRFTEFCLTVEAQALWQFRVKRDTGDDLGPELSKLRRMPIRPVMYNEPYFSKFVDQVNPFERAADLENRGWRSAIAPMMSAFAIENQRTFQQAWGAIIRAREDPEFSPSVLEQMEAAFYAMPTHTLADGTELEFNEANYQQIKRDAGSWRGSIQGERSRVQYVKFFGEQYREVLRLAREGGHR